MTRREVGTWLSQLPSHPAGHCQERADRVVYPPGHRTDTRPHTTSQLSNTSRIIGFLFQLASKSQTLLTFLGHSCRNGHSQHMSFTSVRGLMQRTNNKRKSIQQWSWRPYYICNCICKKKRVTALTCDTLNKTCLSLPAVLWLINQLFIFCWLVSTEFWPWVTSNTMQFHWQPVHTTLITSSQHFSALTHQPIYRLWYEKVYKNHVR